MRTKKLKTVKEASSLVEKVFTEEPAPKRLLPSGCDIFNLACSGKTTGWIYPGMMANIVGDSNSGKTFLALTIQAAIYYKYRDEYEYDFEDLERAVAINIKEMFGEAFAKALHLNEYTAGPDSTIERYYKRTKRKLTKPNAEGIIKPRVMVCDSFDNLSCFAELKAFEKQDKAKEGEEKQSIGTQKAKAASERLGKLQQLLADTGSILIIISQVRDSIPQGFVKFNFDTKTRNGGKALRFYSALEIWLATGSRIGANKKRPIGNTTSVVVKRSKITGRYRTCKLPILYAYGVDSTRATLLFLAEEGFIKGKGVKNPVYTVDNGLQKDSQENIKFSGTMRECIEYIESDSNKEKGLRKFLASSWEALERKVRKEACGNRKPKFGN